MSDRSPVGEHADHDVHHLSGAIRRHAQACRKAVDGSTRVWALPLVGVTITRPRSGWSTFSLIDHPGVFGCRSEATCAPNTLLTDDGRWSGHVDLGSLGVADRWADLAVATWSTEWNYAPGWQEFLLEAYGTEPDPERISYYRLLWDLGP